MGKSIGVLSLDIEINSSSLSDKVKQEWQKAQTYADDHTIKYSFTGDKSQLEGIMKQIQGMNPEVRTGFVIDFDDKEYKRQLEFLQNNSDKKAKEIGKNFEKYIGQSFEGIQFNAKNIADVKDLKQVAKELQASTQGFTIDGAGFKDIEKQIVSLKQLEAVLKELESRGESSFARGKAGNVGEVLSATSSKIVDTIKSATPIIEQNAKEWAHVLETEFVAEFKNILSWVNAFKDAVQHGFTGGFGDFSSSLEDIESQLNDVNSKLEEAKKKKEELEKSAKKSAAPSYDIEAKGRAIATYRANNLNKLNSGSEEHIAEFKRLVDEYMKIGGQLSAFRDQPVGKLIDKFGITQADMAISKEYAQQLQEVNNQIEQLTSQKTKLETAKTQVSKGGNAQSTTGGTPSSSSDTPGTPTKATVSPELSGDFKEKLQEKVTAIGSVDVAVAPDLDEKFKENAQQQVRDLGTVDMGVSFSQEKKEGDKSQEIAVDVVATPKLSDAFKTDLQSKVDQLGSYEVQVELKNKEDSQPDTNGAPTLINIKPANTEEFKAELKSGIEGEKGLDVKVNPVVDPDFKLEIKDVVLKDVKVDGKIAGGHLTPESVETPTSDGQGDAGAKLEETKQQHEQVGEAAVESGKKQKQSLFEVIKEIERLEAEQEKLKREYESQSDSGMSAFINGKRADAAKFQSVNDIVAKIQEKNSESITGKQKDMLKHFAGLIAYVERFKELAGEAFSYDVLGENGEEIFNRMKHAVDEATKSTDGHNQKIREMANSLTGLRSIKDELIATATSTEKLEAELYAAAKAAETLAPKGKKTITVNTDSKKFTEFFEKWKEYKDGGGTRNITEFTKEAKVINTVNREYNAYLEAKKAAKAEETKQAVAAERAARAEQLELQKHVKAAQDMLTQKFPDVDLTPYAQEFDKILSKEKSWADVCRDIQESILAVKAAAGTGADGGSDTPIPLEGNGEINVIPKVENPTEFANKVTEQLKGVSADINITLDEATLSNLATLDTELSKIIEKIQAIAGDTVKVNVDYSSVEKLFNPNEKGTSVIDSLKKNIEGLQTGVLKELGTALSSLNVRNDLDIKIVNLAIALGELKEILNGFSPDSNNFLTTLKDLSNNASGLKDLATIIQASKKDIEKAQEAISKSKGGSIKDDTALAEKMADGRERANIKAAEQERKEEVAQAAAINKNLEDEYKLIEKIDDMRAKSAERAQKELDKQERAQSDAINRALEDTYNQEQQLIEQMASGREAANIKASAQARKEERAQAEAMNKALEEQYELVNQIADAHAKSNAKTQKENDARERAQAEAINRTLEEQYRQDQELVEQMAAGRERSNLRQQEADRTEELAIAQAINKAQEEEYRIKQKNDAAAKKLLETEKNRAYQYQLQAKSKLSDAVSKYSYGDSSQANALIGAIDENFVNISAFEDLDAIIAKTNEEITSTISKLKQSHDASLRALEDEIKQEANLQKQKDDFNKRNLNAIDYEIKKREEEQALFAKSLKAKMQQEASFMGLNEAYDEATQINNALNNTANLMRQFSNSNIQGFDRVFERAQAQVDELNRKLTQGNIENVQKGYTDKVNKIVSDLRGIQTVIQPGNIQYAQEFMKQYATTLNNGAVKIGNFINHGKTLNVTLEEQGGILHNIALEYNDVTGAISLVEKGSKKAIGSLGEFLTGLKYRFASLAQYLLTFVSFYRIWGIIKNGVQVIRDLDTALTEMRKVSDESVASLKEFQKVSFDIAETVGTTAKQIQESTADWMRLGETMQEAARSAEIANILLNVSEFESIDEATESLVAMSQAYKDLDKMEIVDKLNEVGNNYAISTDQIAVALQRSASSLTTAGNDMNEAIALITAGNAVVQDAESVGSGMRTIALRLTGTKAAASELEELGEDADGVITTVSKLRDTIKSASAVASNGFKGFDILDENGNYKSTYEIMRGLAEVYDEIVETDKKNGTNNLNLLLETIAGKNRSNIAASILQNSELLESVYNSSANDSANSAQEELEKYLDSIEGKIATFQNEVQKFWYNLIDTDTVKQFVDAGTQLVKIAENIVSGLIESGAIETIADITSGLVNVIEQITSGLGQANIALVGLLGVVISKSKKNKKGGGRVKMSTLIICHRIV